MKARFAEQVMIAAMVVVHMGDDDVLDRFRIDAEQSQPLAGTPQHVALAALAHDRVETGIDDDRALGIANHPDEIIERHRAIVLVRTEAAKKIFARVPIVMRVLDRIDFVGR